MSWTNERVETLKRMWAEGQSASQIAKELGGVTRNAVIGKVHRLGLSNRTGAPAGEPAPEAATAAEAADTTSPRPETAAGATAAFAEPGPTRQPAGDAETAEESEPDADEMASETLAAEPDAPAAPARRAAGSAGQPLPPQPSANEISPEALASVREVEKKARRLTLMELTERTCKWPVGDPATEDFWFCGLPVQAGKPYCEAHVGVAFQPMSSRRDRRR
ncbi:GcrA cell cycle regulator [Rhodobacteraceae bacterium WD3A24]|nr:GcrA cell cycle regulator [Rhodobacteraceae bacterium WD3A24]